MIYYIVKLTQTNLYDMDPRVEWELVVEDGGRDEELLQEQLELVALVDVIHEYEAFALSIQHHHVSETKKLLNI